MSDTPVTQEVETPETTTPVTEESSAPTQKRGERNDRPNGDRRPPRKDRGGIREEEKEFKEEMIAIDRVTRVTAGGRQLRFRASIIIGDGKGRVGLGLGKSGEVQGAIEKAIRDAKKNIIIFPIVNGTIPHDVAINFKSSSIFLHPAHPGTGIIAGGSVRKIFAVSGIKDIIAKQHGAPNGITNARVAMKALQALKPLSQTKIFSKAKDAAPVDSTPVAPTEKKQSAPKKAPAKKSAE
ncbi:30S ribosomal protein S5 [Candidatus Gracilibacteria bacterium]|nr:30S ribosomal protein S5 [Candidatus Gracilibacteria bacterium]